MYKTPSFDIWHDHFIGNSRLKTHVMLSEVAPPETQKSKLYQTGGCPTEKRLAYFFAV
jgi:hypothetical protein